MRSAMSPVTVETTATGATSKTRPPARGKASGVAAVIEATERAGACTWLSVKARAPVKARRPMEIAAVKPTATKITVMEALVTELTAM